MANIDPAIGNTALSSANYLIKYQKDPTDAKITLKEVLNPSGTIQDAFIRSQNVIFLVGGSNSF